MSKNTLYAILFFGQFPATWIMAWVLDRIWPSNIEREEIERPEHREAHTADR